MKFVLLILFMHHGYREDAMTSTTINFASLADCERVKQELEQDRRVLPTGWSTSHEQWKLKIGDYIQISKCLRTQE